MELVFCTPVAVCLGVFLIVIFLLVMMIVNRYTSVHWNGFRNELFK